MVNIFLFINIFHYFILFNFTCLVDYLTKEIELDINIPYDNHIGGFVHHSLPLINMLILWYFCYTNYYIRRSRTGDEHLKNLILFYYTII
jgi:hypothetical protein